MPALFLASKLNILIDRSTSSLSNATVTSNTSKVVCAWPVSGQYGPGSRVLYYVLLATCVLARKQEWLRAACLAAALLFPAVAALHGIVLAAVHVDGAVDMDIYGAFQLCSISILAIPVTATQSQTYFNVPGRNIVFLWTSLILAGSSSLTVEFYRTNTSNCTHDDFGNPISPNANNFPYAENPSCGLICSIPQGPFSPMRGGSTNNIYVIPAPHKLTFDTATSLAAGCCIPAILSLIFMRNKILYVNWKTHFGNGDEEEHSSQIKDGIRYLSGRVKIPLISGVVLAIISIGEMNFFSTQVRYETEPIASIGQWAPIVGSGLAISGSSYLSLAKYVNEVKEKANQLSLTHHCTCLPQCECLLHHHNKDDSHSLHAPSQSSRDTAITNENVTESTKHDPKGSLEIERVEDVVPTASLQMAVAPSDTSNGSILPNSQPDQEQSDQARLCPSGKESSGRRKLDKVVSAMSDVFFGKVAQNSFDDSAFKNNEARDFPEIPGEEPRNIRSNQIRQQWNPRRDTNGNITPEPRGSRSRAHSDARSLDSGLSGEVSPTTSRVEPLPLQQLPRTPSPLPSPIPRRIPHLNTPPIQSTACEPSDSGSPSSPGSPGGGALSRRDTLEVPPQIYHRPMMDERSASSHNSNSPH